MSATTCTGELGACPPEQRPVDSGIAMLMSRGHFRHLPVSGDTGLVGMLDITDVCRALIDPTSPSAPPPATPGRGNRATCRQEACHQGQTSAHHERWEPSQADTQRRRMPGCQPTQGAQLSPEVMGFRNATNTGPPWALARVGRSAGCGARGGGHCAAWRCWRLRAIQCGARPAQSVACPVLRVAARKGWGVWSWRSCAGTVLVAAVLPCAFAVSSRECVLMAMFGRRR